MTDSKSKDSKPSDADRKKPADESPPAPAGPRWMLAVAVLSLAVAIAVAGVAGFLWHQGRQALDTQRELQQRLTGLEAQVDQSSQVMVTRDSFEQALAEVRESIDTLGKERRATQALLENLRSLAEGGRTAWLHAEVAYLLGLADQTLRLRHDRGLSLEALRLADRRLQHLGDPRLLPVREAIADAITALEAMPDPDVAGMALRLASLSERAAQWPLKTPARPEARRAREATQSGAGEDGGVLESLKRVARGLVIVRRHDEPLRPMISVERERILRLDMALKLDLARLALLRRNPEMFHEQLGAAVNWLEKRFDTSSPAVRGALQQLRELRQAELSPEAPDLSAPLERLREVTRGNRSESGT